MRVLSRAATPCGAMPSGRPARISARHTDGAKSRETQISYPRSPVYPVRLTMQGASVSSVVTEVSASR